MLRVTLRSVWEHKLRLAFTALAIVLGVAFMSGTLVLGDTIDRTFDDLFADAQEGVDVQVQGREVFDGGFGGGSNREELDISVVDTVQDVDGVDRAVPFVQTVGFGSTNRVIGPDGDPLGSSQGPPTLLENWIADDELNPYRMQEGEPPGTDDELALNVGAAESAGLSIGDTVTVLTQFGEKDYTVSGTFLFGTAESSGGATSVDFTLAEAQRIAGLENQAQVVLVAGDGSVPDEELAQRVDQALPDGAEAITGEEAADQLAGSIQEGFQFFQILLIVFALIAVVVGGFIIYNTFSILIAQRTRELALLRAIGAGRRQVFGSVVAEAAIIGLVATVVGLGAGVGLATAVVNILSSGGADFPTTSLVVGANTVVVAFVLGLGFTMALSIFPALRATRVPPLAALREVAIDRSGASKPRVVGGVVLLLLAAILLSTAWMGEDATTTVGMGALALILGALVVGPVLAGPSVRILGSPLSRFGRVTGRLATQNAARSPKRTAATASALLIGVALIGFILIFAESARASVTEEVERGFSGDLVVQASGGGFGPPSGFPPSVADQIADVDGVDSVTRLSFTQVQLTYPDGATATKFLTALDPTTVMEAFEPRMEQGELTDLTADGLIVDAGIAEGNDLAIGDTVPVTGPGGQTAELQVEAISDDFTIVGDGAIDLETYGTLVSERQVLQVFVLVDDGADLGAVQRDIDGLIGQYPGLDVLDKEGFIGDISSQITGILNFVVALLGLSVVIAVIGIINTLSLSIHERTRELGLLRAVGMSRGQVFRSVNLEAVIIAVLGTLVGLGVGLLVSWALVSSLAGFGLGTFQVPVVTLVFVVVVAALLGVLASLFPAWRATRLKILDAIATE